MFKNGKGVKLIGIIISFLIVIGSVIFGYGVLNARVDGIYAEVKKIDSAPVEIAGMKSDIGNIESDIGKIELEQKTLRKDMNKGFTEVRREMNAGFNRIMDKL